ncbi:MAG: M48 family metallopeptidase [Woronichinia naegeliana WA131]|jgi:Zn-dependent protease with chaperone function|uniref:M48 family metallopeptidase n=1 Tax=Woronichinia naegeliana WA131 TaxID=2824559 RepID=A0A977PUB1_9CYAN|nr:MAG: M48 family metallopeptidase [Woronichinia naegeliana WA131]
MVLSPTLLVGLKADDFRHPLDLAATNSLKQLPGFDLAIRGLLGSVAEQFFALNNLAASVRVSSKQLPHLHELLLEACRILDLDPPQLYVQQNPIPNAYTFAMRGKQPFMVLHTSLIEMLTPVEIQAVMAHELGHLKCEHGVYLTLANLIALASEQLPIWGTMIAQSLQSQILEWVRCAEFSCDRAALLAVQDPRIVMSVLMKLAGGSPSLAPLLNLDAFIEQAREYQAISETELGTMLKSMQTEALTHPVPVLRAKEIDRWASSQNYQDLLQGPRSLYNQKDKTQGGWRNW